MKKAIIIDQGGQLGNQLWNYMSVYAYALEKGYQCYNWPFYQYQYLFPNTRNNFFIKLFFGTLERIFPGKKSFIKNILYRKLILAPLYKNKPKKILNSHNLSGWRAVNLPPSISNSPEQAEALAQLERSEKDIYFDGPAFRNPAGVIKYRREIRAHFAPRAAVRKKVDEFLNARRKDHDYLVGVHIRQKDYQTWSNGQFYFSPEKAAVIIKDFLRSRDPKEKIGFIIASDEPVDMKIFSGLDAIPAPGGITEDLFTLAGTDLIIGSNSTFGAFAAYYGNIPMAIFKDGPTDWNLYRQKKEFFFNPESLAHLAS